MNHSDPPLDLSRLKVLPLEQRRSLTRVEEILVAPETAPPPCPPSVHESLAACAEAVRQARRRGSSVILMYGAHLLRNGAALILDRLMDRGWITHLATNGAGTIHDWEYAYLGRSTESVEANVANGTFGAWDETGRVLHLALLAGGIQGEGYGFALGSLIVNNGVQLPTAEALTDAIRQEPLDPLTPARADLLQAMVRHAIPGGRLTVPHAWPHASIAASAFRHRLPFTVHPGIGYDIIANHPMFNGAAIGRAAAVDFRKIAASIDRLDHGVVLAVGSAIMAPQVFEKSLSCVHNLRIQAGRPTVQGHSIFVVDLQEGGLWDWRQGEPPKTHPAYYLRFCKSFSRMGGTMHYVCCDNRTFIHHLLHALEPSSPQP